MVKAGLYIADPEMLDPHLADLQAILEHRSEEDDDEG
jgi:hypothetical protein